MLKPLCFAALAALFFASCTSEPEWTADQRAVHEAALRWSAATAARDAAAMWDMMCKDSHDWYDRELRAEGGVRQVVKLAKVGLEEGSRLSEADKQKRREELARLPDDPDKMDAKAWYVWKTERALSQKEAENTAGLFARENIKSLSVQGDEATIVLKDGSPDRYSLVRHDGDWKFTLPPSTMRALEDARKRETGPK